MRVLGAAHHLESNKLLQGRNALPACPNQIQTDSYGDGPYPKRCKAHRRSDEGAEQRRMNSAARRLGR
jgi:hypothetical protein